MFLGINILCFIKSFVYNKGKAFKYISYYIFSISLIQILSIVIVKIYDSNLFLSHFYFLIQFVFISLFYKEILKEKLASKMIKVSFIVIPAIILSQYLIDVKLFNSFNLLEVLLTSVPILILSLLYYFKSLTEKIIFPYVNTGVFIYLLGSTLIFASASVTTGLSRDLNKYLWRINSILYLIFQFLIFYEWYKNIRHNKVLEIN